MPAWLFFLSFSFLNTLGTTRHWKEEVRHTETVVGYREFKRLLPFLRVNISGVSLCSCPLSIRASVHINEARLQASSPDLDFQCRVEYKQ